MKSGVVASATRQIQRKARLPSTRYFWTLQVSASKVSAWRIVDAYGFFALAWFCGAAMLLSAPFLAAMVRRGSDAVAATGVG